MATWGLSCPRLLSKPSSHAKSINKSAAKPHCSSVTLSRLTSPELPAGDFIFYNSCRTSGSGLLTTLTMTLECTKPWPPITESSA